MQGCFLLTKITLVMHLQMINLIIVYYRLITDGMLSIDQYVVLCVTVCIYTHYCFVVIVKCLTVILMPYISVFSHDQCFW